MEQSYTVKYLNKPDTLSGLSKKFGSDKGSPIPRDRFGTGIHSWMYHSYTDFYEHLFGPWRLSVTTLFECGLGTNNLDIQSSMGPTGTPGASLRMWKEFFPNAHIYGADIDKRVLFTEDRISTYYVDQLDPTSVSNLITSLPSSLDIIIDDGLHSAPAAITLFKGMFSLLRPGGIYIVEDVWGPGREDGMRDKLELEMSSLGVSYNIVEFSKDPLSALMVIYKPI